MKPIRMVLWFMFLHHLPGICAPDNEEHSADGRVREHLLGATGDVVTDIRTRMIAALESETAYNNTNLLAWAAREATERAPSAVACLRVTVDELRESATREMRKVIRGLPPRDNKRTR